MTEVVFPTLDEDAPDAQGVLATWFVDEGVTVRVGQLLAEVQVAKVSGEIAAPRSGVIRRKIGEGDVVRQGTVVALIE